MPSALMHTLMTTSMLFELISFLWIVILYWEFCFSVFDSVNAYVRDTYTHIRCMFAKLFYHILLNVAAKQYFCISYEIQSGIIFTEQTPIEPNS